MPLFRTGSGTTEDTVIVALELVDLDWFKRNLIGALELMCRDENWLQIGDATTDFARDKANEMLEGIMLDVIIPPPTPTGTVAMWIAPTIPDGWLRLNGDALLEADYPELFALIGYTYGGGSGTFVLPNLGGYSPMGASGFIALMETKGNTNVQITQDNLPDVDFPVTDPTHSHAKTDPGHSHAPAAGTSVFVGRTAGGTTDWVRATAGATFRQDAATAAATTGISYAAAATGISVHSGGIDQSLDIVHPVVGVYYIIKAG